MSSTVTVYPNGDGTKTGWSGTGDTTNLYANVDEGTVLPNDSDYNSAISNVPLYLLLGDMPGDFGTAVSVTIKLRLKRLTGKGFDRDFSNVSLVQSDETTAITANGNISGQTGTITTNTVSPSITGGTGKSVWDGARLKIHAPTSSSGGTVYFYAAQVEITYNPAAGNPNGGSGPQTARLIQFISRNP